MRVEYTVVCSAFYEGLTSEDYYYISEAGGGRPFIAVVVDGHGSETNEQGNTPYASPLVAQFAQQVGSGIIGHLAQFPDPIFLADAFVATSEEVDRVFEPLTEIDVIDEGNFFDLDVGAVVTAIIVEDDRIHLAQAGDCRLYTEQPDWVLGFLLLTKDHTGDHSGEIERLRPLTRSGAFRIATRPGGYGLPTYDGPDCLYYRDENGQYLGSRQTTRGFGDYEYRPAMIPTPECRQIDLSAYPPGQLFALCSDGGNKIVQKVLECFRGRTREVSLEEINAAAQALLVLAEDDVTIIFFRQVG